MSRSLLGFAWTDCLVIAARSLTFAAAVVSHGHRRPQPPSEQTLQAVATDLGVTTEQLRHAAGVVPPPAPGNHPTPAQRAETRRALAHTLNVSVEQLDTVMRKHQPARRD